MIMRVARRPVLLAALAGAAVQSGPPNASAQQPSLFDPSNREIAENFIRIAFGGDAQTGLAPRQALVKWSKPIEVGIIGSARLRHTSWFERHAGYLTWITGHPIFVVSSGNPNVFVLLADDPVSELAGPLDYYWVSFFSGDRSAANAEVEKMKLEKPFFGRCIAGWDSQNNLISCFILLSTAHGPTVTWQGIVEEMSQMLGLLGDDDAVAWSIFNDKSPYVDLTPQDVLMLRVLYDRRLVAGMNRDAAKAAALTVLNDLRPGR
jgi:hypothetical protein